MLAIDRKLPSVAPGARMLLQIHDELVIEVPEGEALPAKALLENEMKSCYPLDVPLVVGVGVGSSWGDAH
jgi:DNA polymerase-1